MVVLGGSSIDADIVWVVSRFEFATLTGRWFTEATVVGLACESGKAAVRGGEARGRAGTTSVSGGNEAGPVCHVRLIGLDCLEGTGLWVR